MKLYSSNRAPNPRRVRWFMAEKGINDIEVIDVDLLKGEHRAADYIERAGIAQCPALTLDDGDTITESVAICRYLESLYPEPNMFGRTPKETAVIEMWTRRAEMLCATPLMLAVRHGHPALAALETQVPEVAANNRAQGERSLAFFDRRLAESPWIAADRVTIADGVLFVGMEFARLVRFAVPEELTHLAAWQKTMRERASAAAGA
jgi:glutathione S-transferase